MAFSSARLDGLLALCEMENEREDGNESNVSGREEKKVEEKEKSLFPLSTVNNPD